MRSPSSAIGLAGTAQKFGNAVELDHAGLMQGDGKRVLNGLHQRRCFRMQYALSEDRSVFRGSAFEVVILDRGDQPDVGVVEEGLKVGAAERLACLALGVDRLADRGQVDRSEVANEIGISKPPGICADPQGLSSTCARRTSPIAETSGRPNPQLCYRGILR